MDVDVVKVHVAIASVMTNDKVEKIEQKRNGRPHSAHSFSTRKLSPGEFSRFSFLYQMFFKRLTFQKLVRLLKVRSSIVLGSAAKDGKN